MARESWQYSDEETQHRFEKVVKAALNTPPKPIKRIIRRRPKRQPRTKSKKPRIREVFALSTSDSPPLVWERFPCRCARLLGPTTIVFIGLNALAATERANATAVVLGFANTLRQEPC